MPLTLEPLTGRHHAGYLAMLDECDAAGEGYPYNNADLARSDFAAFVAECADESAGVGLPPLVPAQTTYVLCADGVVVGEMRLRPRLTEPYLDNGHVGYNLTPSARGRGLATQGLALLVAEAGRRGVNGLSVPIEASNAASVAVTEHNGGRLARGETRDGVAFWVYWLDTGTQQASDDRRSE